MVQHRQPGKRGVDRCRKKVTSASQAHDTMTSRQSSRPFDLNETGDFAPHFHDRQLATPRREANCTEETEKFMRTLPSPQGHLPRKWNAERRLRKFFRTSGTAICPLCQTNQADDQRLDVLHDKMNRQRNLHKTGSGSSNLRRRNKQGASGQLPRQMAHFSSEKSHNPVPALISVISPIQNNGLNDDMT